MRIVEENEVRSILRPEICLETMRQAFTALENGECDMPQRLICRMPNTAAFGFMPAYLGPCFGAKVITAYGKNMGTEYPSHIGYVIMFESEHCTVTGLVEAGSITEIRTGCVSALATDMLARKDASRLALIGAGAQARSHLAAIRLVRELDEVTVFDLNPAAMDKFAAWAQEQYGIAVRLCASAAEAVRDADIICTLCPAKEPYLFRDMVRPGVHINAVGTFSPVTREVGSDLIAASRLFSDQTEAAKKESGEYLIPLQEGLIGEDHIVASLGQLVTGKCQGRLSDTEITVFDALGLAVEDVAAAARVLSAM